MDKLEGYFEFNENGEFMKVSDFPCVFLNDNTTLTDSRQTASKLSMIVSE